MSDVPKQPQLRGKPEPVQVVKQRRDAALEALVGGVPYIQFMGIRFDRRGDELTAILPYACLLYTSRCVYETGHAWSLRIDNRLCGWLTFFAFDQLFAFSDQAAQFGYRAIEFRAL